MLGLDDKIASLGSGEAFVLVAVVAVLLGLRHATDPDHLTAVTTLIAGAHGHDHRSARSLGWIWGLGHATTLFLFGLPIVIAKNYLPEPIQQAAEAAVGVLIIGLALYQAAFISEVYRSGIQSVPKGHREAAQVLGLTPIQSFNRIVLPQAIRMTLPPLASNFVQLIKFSSLGAVISVSEITRRGMELSATNFRPLETFTFIAVVYFFICWPLAMAIRAWERRLANQ